MGGTKGGRRDRRCRCSWVLADTGGLVLKRHSSEGWLVLESGEGLRGQGWEV